MEEALKQYPGICEACCFSSGTAITDAIQSAVNKDHAPCLRYLMKEHRDVNTIDKDKNVPLHHAASNGYFECLSILVQAGADVNSLDDENCTPLHKGKKSLSSKRKCNSRQH